MSENPTKDDKVPSRGEQLQVGQAVISLNPQGFLCSLEDWNQDIAKALAVRERVEELTGSHWQVLGILRDYFRTFGIAPSVRKLCVISGLSADSIFELFPTGPAQGACRIAGLPTADGCY